MSTSCPVEISAVHAAAAPREGACVIGSNGRTQPSRRPRKSNCEILAMLMASLLRGSKTRGELAEEVEVTLGAIKRLINALRDQGVVYIQLRRHNGAQGKPVEVFALNPTPFHFQDATTITVQ